MKFNEIDYKRPDINTYKLYFHQLLGSFSAAENFDLQSKILNQLYSLRNDFDTMYRIANIKYTLDTGKQENLDEFEHFNEIKPDFDDLINQFNRALVTSKFRYDLEVKWGKHLFDLAELSLKTFAPEIMEELKKEIHLSTEYTTLLSSARIFFDGKERNLNGLAPYEGDIARDIRKKASDACWKFFSDNSEKLDAIFSELVDTRDKMAKKLGYKNYTALGYARMKRIDYNPDMVANFRKQVKEYVVPIATKLRQRQAKRLTINKLKYVDEKLYFITGNPKPKVGTPEIVKNAIIMYSELSEETNDFFNFIVENELMDLDDKKGKAGGGYCSYLPKYNSPFIFTNFNGTAHDITVLTHEAGHAFQKFSSMDYEVPEYLYPTAESAEIHSMSMELFNWPWINLFFHEDADKYKFEHLSSAVLFLPYGAAVDEFQHFVYENPDVSSHERNHAWREIERKYLPHRNYEDNHFLEKGGFWHSQRHIYKWPFYYIDYALAQVCAFQFWQKANTNFKKAWDDYLKLCRAGGRKSFLELIKLAGLESPFEDGCIQSVVYDIENFLESIDDNIL